MVKLKSCIVGTPGLACGQDTVEVVEHEVAADGPGPATFGT